MTPSRPRAGRPTATVLIPAHNEAATVVDLVKACLRQPYPLEDIVVVADSCTDDTAEMARLAGATKVIEVHFKDKASSQNAGLFDIFTDVVVGFDGDTIPEPDCIELMIRDIENGFDATCATVLPIQPRGFFIRARRFAYALGRRWWRLCQARVGRIQVLTGAAYVFKTEAIKSIGGFPGGLISADMDATWALHKARYKFGYAGDAVALTYDPETFSVYRQQMRRWSSGYFQNMAKYRRELLHWRAMLVVWTALFDLCCIFAYETALAITVITGHYKLASTFALWLAIHAVVTTGLVATVVGVREAVLGYFPYLIVNYYNKWLYLCAFAREWILGRHYVSWTGRQGRKTVITKMSRTRKLVLTSSAAVIMCIAGFNWPELQQTVKQTVLPSRPVAAKPVVVTAKTRYAGVVAYNLPQFDETCGCRPNLAVRDVGVGSLIDNVPPQTMIANGAVPLIELEPFGVKLRSIVAGKEDKWLARQAKAIARLPGTVLMSFAPEANGKWYTWGYSYVTPGEYVAAWRHVVRMFAADHRVKWVWMVNRLFVGSEPIRLLWPGKKYVNIVGIDGYFHRSDQTYAMLFDPTIQYIRSFTRLPILLTEVAARPRAGKARAMAQLIAGTRRYHTLGFIWFDVNKAPVSAAGNMRFDWRIDTSSAALATFRRFARVARKT
jgi:biofilm PGA synthesis N-glycosyltransferase PgaC